MTKDNVSKAIDEIPEKGGFVLQVKKDQPHWFLRYGNFLVLLFLSLCVLLYFLFI